MPHVLCTNFPFLYYWNYNSETPNTWANFLILCLNYFSLFLVVLALNNVGFASIMKLMVLYSSCLIHCWGHTPQIWQKRNAYCMKETIFWSLLYVGEYWTGSQKNRIERSWCSWKGYIKCILNNTELLNAKHRHFLSSLYYVKFHWTACSVVLSPVSSLKWHSILQCFMLVSLSSCHTVSTFWTLNIWNFLEN